jgi:hypothetical protein
MAINIANIKYYLSGGASNSDPLLSIGGAKSSVAVSATALHNLFDAVTGDEAAAGVTRYRLVYLQNDDADASGLLAPAVLWWSTSPAAGQTIAVGLAAAGKGAAETAVADENTAPAGVTFTSPVSKATGVSLTGTPYTQGQYIGVWLRVVTTAGAAKRTTSGAPVLRLQADGA